MTEKEQLAKLLAETVVVNWIIKGDQPLHKYCQNIKILYHNYMRYLTYDIMQDMFINSTIY